MECEESRILRIAGIVKESYTDGPGIRCTVFTQGCRHNCFKCHNPETHDFNNGFLLDNQALLGYLKSNTLLSGVTFSGGDPMYQPKACEELARLIKDETNLNIWCYSGFTFEQILENKSMVNFLRYIDILVDGPYIDSQRQLSLRFRGSTNQRIVDVQRSLNEDYCIEYNLH